MSDSNTVILSTEEIEQIIVWVKQAGQIALKHQDNIKLQHKEDKTLVTQADLEIEQFLVEKLTSAFPEHAIVGEEGARNRTDDTSACLWAIDPIDGTSSYVYNLPGWGIALGLLYQGRPNFGIFYMPTLDDLSYTTGADLVYCNGRDIQGAVRTEWGPLGFLAVSSGAHHEFQINARRTRTLGSCSATLVYTARGTAGATFMSRPGLWDLVAGVAILNRAGGELRYLSGKPIDYELLTDGRSVPEPVIAGHPLMLAELDGAIKRISESESH